MLYKIDRLSEKKRGRKKVLLPDWMKDILQNGWTKVGPYSVNGERFYIKKNMLQDTVLRFDTKGLGRYYKASDFFGEQNSLNGWWYLETNPDTFVTYLEDSFRLANEDAQSNSDKRKAFTMLMHANRLHWSQCCQHKRKYIGEKLEWK